MLPPVSLFSTAAYFLTYSLIRRPITRHMGGRGSVAHAEMQRWAGIPTIYDSIGLSGLDHRKIWKRLGTLVGLGVHKTRGTHVSFRSFSCGYHVAIYFNHLLQTHRTKGALTTAAYGINWAHHVGGFASPLQDPFVKLVLQGCERLCGKPTTKKDPLTCPMIKELIDLYIAQVKE